MKKLAARSLAAGVLLASISWELATAGEMPEDQLLGIRLGMSEPEATQVLSKLGRPNPTMGGLKQGWELEDPHWGHLVLRYDGKWRVRWVTLLARPDAIPFRFGDIGDLGQAEPRGYYVYMWSVPADGDRESYTVTARGSDPEFVSSLSLSSYIAPRAASTPRLTGK